MKLKSYLRIGMIGNLKLDFSAGAQDRPEAFLSPHISGETDFARERDSKGGIVNFTKTSFTEVC